MTRYGPAGRRPMHEAAMLAATAFPLGIAAAWRTRPHRRPPSRELQKCVAARRGANLAFGAETRTRNHSAWAHLSRDISIKPLLYRKIRNQKPERWVPPKGSSHPEHAAVLVLPFDPFGIRLVNEGSFRRNDPSGRSFIPRKTRTQSVWTDNPMARMFSVGCGEKAEYRELLPPRLD